MEELINLDELTSVLEDLAKDIRENYKEHLEHSGRYTMERGLIDSVRTEVKEGNWGFEVTMTLNDYWKYVESDTRPHFPPPDKILRWIEIKPIHPRPMANGAIPTPKQLAFLISRKISEVGTKGSHDLEKVKDGVIPQYLERLSKALAHDVGMYVRNLMTTDLM